MSKVLVVEDDMFLRQLYMDLLVSEKLNVEAAEDGNSGYEMLKKGGWDLVLLDMNLPGMSGLDILNRLKAEGRYGDSKKVVFMTASSSPQQLEDMQKISDGYLIKTDLNPDEFITKVKEYLVP